MAVQIRITEPLRKEHEALLPRMDQIQDAADSIGEISIEATRRKVDAVYDFLTHDLIPHAAAEERGLYPLVGRILGAPEATATMSHDHTEIARLTAELARLRPEPGVDTLDAFQIKKLRRVLYGLHTLATVHFTKEEEIYLPILDAHLTHEDLQYLFGAMDQAAVEARFELTASELPLD